jgi:hypothetical protein
MGTTINRPPLGLNDLLQLQSKGVNPNDLQNTIQATIDYSPYLLANIPYTTFTDSATLVVAGAGTWSSGIDIPVLEGELWFVYGLWIDMAATIQNGAQFTYGMKRTDAGLPQVLKSTRPYGDGVISKRISDSIVFEQPLICRAPVAFGVYVTYITVNVSCELRVLHKRVKI